MGLQVPSALSILSLIPPMGVWMGGNNLIEEGEGDGIEGLGLGNWESE